MAIEWNSFTVGAASLATISHALATVPTSDNKWLQWLLGIVKFAIGQRITGVNAFNGLQSEVTAVTSAQKEALMNGSSMRVVRSPEGTLKPVTSEEPLEKH